MSRTSCDRVLSPCGHSSTNQIWSGLLAGIRLTVRPGRGGFSATSRSILKISSNVIAQASTPLDGPSTRRTPLTRKSYANIEQQRIEAPKAQRRRQKGSVATLELRRSLAIASAKLDRHGAEQTKNEA